MTTTFIPKNEITQQLINSLVLGFASCIGTIDINSDITDVDVWRTHYDALTWDFASEDFDQAVMSVTGTAFGDIQFFRRWDTDKGLTFFVTDNAALEDLTIGDRLDKFVTVENLVYQMFETFSTKLNEDYVLTANVAAGRAEV